MLLLTCKCKFTQGTRRDKNTPFQRVFSAQHYAAYKELFTRTLRCTLLRCAGKTLLGDSNAQRVCERPLNTALIAPLSRSSSRPRLPTVSFPGQYVP